MPTSSTTTRTEHVYRYQTKTGDTRYYVLFYYHDWQGHNVKKKKSGFLTQAAARQWEIDFRRTLAGSSSMPFADLFAEYMQSKAHAVKVTTIEQQKGEYARYIADAFASMPVNAITADTITHWQGGLAGQGLAANTINQIHGLLASCLYYAVKRGYIPKNPAAIVRRVKDTTPTAIKHLHIWTREQFDHFILSGLKPQYITLYSLLFWTGCRIGEVLAFRASDVDTQRGTISITRDIRRVKGGKVFQTPKTPHSIRTVTLPGFMTAMLAEWIHKTGAQGSDLLFTLCREHVNAELRKHAREAGLPPICVHDLRHSHASMLIHLGVQPIAIRDRLGHASIKITLDTYGHLYPNTDSDIAVLLSS